MRLKRRLTAFILDRYVALNFLAYFIVCAFALVGLVLVIETFQMLHKLIKYGFFGMLWVLAQYYLYNTPVILSDIFPVMGLVGAAYCLVEMAKGNEMVALKASGVSIYRIVAPIFVATAFIALLAAVNQEWFLPRIGPAIENFDRKHDLARGVLSDKFGDAEDGRLKYRVHEFDVETATFRDAVFRRLEESSESIKELIEAEDGRWEGKDNWVCHKVHKKTYLEGGQREDEYFEEYVLHTDLTPDDLLEDDLKPGYRNLRGLYKRIKLEPERMNLRLALQSRFTQPLSAIILLLIGLPPVVGSERFAKNRVLGIGVSLLVGGGFYLVSFVCEHLATHGYIPVAGLAAWTPVIMFGALGIYFFDSMRT